MKLLHSRLQSYLKLQAALEIVQELRAQQLYPLSPCLRPHQAYHYLHCYRSACRFVENIEISYPHASMQNFEVLRLQHGQESCEIWIADPADNPELPLKEQKTARSLAMLRFSCERRLSAAAYA